MKYRTFGKTGLRVSELGFGTWGIGGGYGQVQENESLDALAKAEELGCNFVDTASVYGNAEDILGRFLSNRRDRWILSTKWTMQATITEHIEYQLKTLKTDYIDFYQLHNCFFHPDHIEYLYKLKQSGKVRFIGVSLGSATSKNVGLLEQEIDDILETELDGIQIPISLFSAEPFKSYKNILAKKGFGILIRSTLERGFLTGKLTVDSKFGDKDNRRDIKDVERMVKQAELFRFLQDEVGSMTAGAMLYSLSFPEISTVLSGTKTVKEAEFNFNLSGTLKQETIDKITSIQNLYKTQRLTD